jgi:hypothetical protein
MSAPVKPSRPVVPPRRAGASLPGADCPLDPPAVAAILTARLTEDVRALHPTVRGIGIRQGWRREAIRKSDSAPQQAAYATRNIPMLLAELVCDPRLPTDGICGVLEALALEIRAMRGESQDAGPWVAVMERETEAQGATDVQQWRAAEARTPGVLRQLASLFTREAEIKRQAAVVTLREAERLERPALVR